MQICFSKQPTKRRSNDFLAIICRSLAICWQNRLLTKWVTQKLDSQRFLFQEDNYSPMTHAISCHGLQWNLRHIPIYISNIFDVISNGNKEVSGKTGLLISVCGKRMYQVTVVTCSTKCLENFSTLLALKTSWTCWITHFNAPQSYQLVVS